jgi:hypothetical protein
LGFFCLLQTGRREGLLEIAFDILEVFDAETDAEQIGCDIDEWIVSLSFSPYMCPAEVCNEKDRWLASGMEWLGSAWDGITYE